jgi:hypothetical protein
MNRLVALYRMLVAAIALYAFASVIIYLMTHAELPHRAPPRQEIASVPRKTRQAIEAAPPQPGRNLTANTISQG